MHFILRIKLLCAIASAALISSVAVYAGEPPTEPMLRIDPGGHTGSIQRIATDKAGRWLVTASLDKTARVWDMRDGRLVTTLRVPIGSDYEGKLAAVALSPDGQTVAVGGVAILDNSKSNSISNSIYLFNRASGRLLRRLTGLPESVYHLAFSHDGRWLAATMFGNNGVRVFAAASGQLLAEDHDYGGDSNSVQFSSDGRLVTTSNDGLLRLYRFDGNRLTLLAKRAAPGGKKPYSAKFSPDGTRIAVGFGDVMKPAVNVLNASDLSLDYAPDTEEAYAGLPVVAWSQDGATLYAAGMAVKDFDGHSQFYIRRWAGAGKGIPVDWPVAENNINDLATLPDGRLAFGGSEPSWGVVNAEGARLLYHAPEVADFREGYGVLEGSYKPEVTQSADGTIVVDVSGLKSDFALSADGARVHFGYEALGKSPAVFDILNRNFLAADTPGLIPPLLKSPGLEVTDWFGMGITTPKLNGTAIDLEQGEKSLSLALSPGGEGFVLGTSFSLKFYDRSGKSLASRNAPGVVLQVNVSSDRRWVVAAFGDGTIRWYDTTFFLEELAFYPHPDKKRWIMWTPEGYYDASPGGEDLIGWHLNQGKDKEARFIPSGQLYDVFFRPDIVQAKFRGDDISGLITITAAEALKNPPPILDFTKVPSASKSSKEKICYKATSTGGGIGEVRLFQNGKLVKSDGFYRETVARKTEEKIQLASLDSATIQRSLRNLQVVQNAPSPIASYNKGNEYEECQELETMPGENEISVAAFNAPNTIQSNIETVRFTVDRKPEEPHLYVLGVGIDKYRDTSAALNFAVKDANDFRAMMQEKAGSLYKPKNIHIEGLSDDAATKAGIQKAIQVLSGKVKPWDSFILFVASHGMLLENQYYIVTAGYNGSMNPANFISSNEIVGMSKNIKSLSQLFIFDTCHAGGVDNIISGLYDARMSVMAKKMGLHIYASAGSTQSAMDGYQGNGLFTNTLLKSMKDGKATDSNHDDQVSVVELGQQARQETMDISKKLGYPQSPNIINFGRDNMLFRVQ